MSVRGRLTVLFVTALALLGAVFYSARKGPSTDGVEAETGVPDLAPAATAAVQDSDTDLPGNALRSALEELCVDAASSAGDPLSDPRLAAAVMGPFDEWRWRLLEQLSTSTESEHLVLGALIDRDGGRMNLVERAVASNPQDAFALWVAVNVCADQYASSGCPRSEWERQLLAVDGQNSESWILVAGNRYQRGDVDGALDALQHAAASAESRAFWVETIEVAERGLAVAGDLAFPERAAMAFGIAASSPAPRISDYVNMCKAQSAVDVNWAYACLAYGQTLEAQGKTEMGLSIAQALQLHALEAIGDEEEFNRVEQRRQQRTHRWRNGHLENADKVDQLTISSPALFSSYLAAIRAHGEIQARTLMTEEFNRLVADRPELACALED